MTTEAKAVAHRIVDLALDRLVGRVIQIAVGVGSLIVDRGRNRLRFDRLAQDHRLDAAAGTERMPKRTLGAADLGLVRRGRQRRA